MEQPRPVARVRRQELKLIGALLGALMLPYPSLYIAARFSKVLVRWRDPQPEFHHFIAQGHSGRLSQIAHRLFTPLRIAEQKSWSWIEKR